MTRPEASIDVDALREAPGTPTESDFSSTVDEEAFEQAAEAQNAQPIAALERGRRRKPQASYLLQPAEREARAATLKLRAREQDVGLKRLLAWVAISAVILQLLVADAFLAFYVVFASQPPSDTVLIAWLSASVVEVIGIVAIVARNLFPNRGRREKRRRRSKSGKN